MLRIVQLLAFVSSPRKRCQIVPKLDESMSQEDGDRIWMWKAEDRMLLRESRMTLINFNGIIEIG